MVLWLIGGLGPGRSRGILGILTLEDLNSIDYQSLRSINLTDHSFTKLFCFNPFCRGKSFHVDECVFVETGGSTTNHNIYIYLQCLQYIYIYIRSPYDS